MFVSIKILRIYALNMNIYMCVPLYAVHSSSIYECINPCMFDYLTFTCFRAWLPYLPSSSWFLAYYCK